VLGHGCHDQRVIEMVVMESAVQNETHEEFERRVMANVPERNGTVVIFW
jgi:cell division protein YceG involved in septum cleavage